MYSGDFMRQLTHCTDDNAYISTAIQFASPVIRTNLLNIFGGNTRGYRGRASKQRSIRY